MARLILTIMLQQYLRAIEPHSVALKYNEYASYYNSVFEAWNTQILKGIPIKILYRNIQTSLEVWDIHKPKSPQIKWIC